MKANKKILLVQYEIIFHVMHEEKKHFSYFDLDWLIVKQVVATYWQRRKQESLYRKKKCEIEFRFILGRILPVGFGNAMEK